MGTNGSGMSQVGILGCTDNSVCASKCNTNACLWGYTPALIDNDCKNHVTTGIGEGERVQVVNYQLLNTLTSIRHVLLR